MPGHAAVSAPTFYKKRLKKMCAALHTKRIVLIRLVFVNPGAFTAPPRTFRKHHPEGSAGAALDGPAGAKPVAGRVSRSVPKPSVRARSDWKRPAHRRLVVGVDRASDAEELAELEALEREMLAHAGVMAVAS